MTFKNVLHLASLLAGLAVPAGCAVGDVALDSTQHTAMLRDDRAMAMQEPAAGDAAAVLTLSLDAALEMGVMNNLDARVAAIEILSKQKTVTVEQLKALPSVGASGGYVGRSNDGASSSRSVISGLQSLEPSQSTDTDRQVAGLEASWNLIDAALALSDARKADSEVGIASERHRKVIQNIERDVYAAYWRALAWQKADASSAAAMEDLRVQIGRLEKARDEKLVSAADAGDQIAALSDRLRSLNGLRNELSLAQIELKAILSLPPGTRLVLKDPGTGPDYKSLLKEKIEDQEWEALMFRPEMREEILQKNITLRDTRREILQTVPGLDLFFGLNYDSNSFLSDPNWADVSAKIAGSITGLLTLPARHRAAKTREDLADARRQAMVAAIMAQTHIARQRLAADAKAYEDARRASRSASRKAKDTTAASKAGFAAGGTVLMSRADREIENMRDAMALAALHDARAAYLNTLGRSVSGAAEISASSSPETLNVAAAD